jgi:hypothetical protein
VSGHTVLLVHCVECGHVKVPEERGWVIVLAPSAERRLHYCSDCIEELVRRASTTDADDRADDE